MGMGLEHVDKMSVNDLDKSHVVVALFWSDVKSLLGPENRILLGFLEVCLH